MMQADEARELAIAQWDVTKFEIEYHEWLASQPKSAVKPLRYDASRGFYRAIFAAGFDAAAALLAHHALEARVALLRELAAEECPACKDGAELFRDEESGQWAHERSGLPNFLCEAPEIVAERLAERASKGAGGGQ